MKQLAIRLLHALAQRVLQKYHPLIVGVTGSYGKTSAKEAIAAALSEAYQIRQSAKSFNNDFGVPFTILGVSPAGGAYLRMFHALRNALQLLRSRQPYPTVLVLELGDDRPGDLAKLLQFIRLDVGVLTAIGPTHLQRFGTVDAVYEEESQVITTLQEHAWAVLNCDDGRIRPLIEQAMCRTVSYGFSGDVAVRCLDVAVAKAENGEFGLTMKILFCGNEIPVFVPGVAGDHSAYAILAGVAVGIVFKLDLVEIADGLRSYQPPPGRMRLLPGVKRTRLIDDTYNSSPDAVFSALEALRRFPTEGTRYAVLGEMADLGASSEDSHRAVGQVLIDNEIDIFITVGEKMKSAAKEAVKLGMPESRIFSFDNPIAAARFVQERFKTNDVVLLKGSQVSRMEKAVKELMAEPEQAEQLLVRQDGKWLEG